MNLEIQEKFDSLLSILKALDLVAAIFFLILILSIWFLPAILAVFMNRKHLGKIFVACIPAGFSLVAWGALIIWAVTGKLGKSKSEKALLKVGGKAEG